MLDDVQQQQLLGLPPSAFDNDRAAWGIVRAQTYGLRGDQAKARIYADSARLTIEEQLRATPEDGQLHAFRGLALAYLGQKAEAIKEGERAVKLWPISRDAYFGPYIQHQLVRIYLLVGEPEKALDQLEPLLKIPYGLSPGSLRIDPTFAPLKGNPRFERLVTGRRARQWSALPTTTRRGRQPDCLFKDQERMPHCVLGSGFSAGRQALGPGA